MIYQIEIKKIYVDETGEIQDDGWRPYKKYKSRYHAIAAAFGFCIPSLCHIEKEYGIPMARIIIKEM